MLIILIYIFCFVIKFIKTINYLTATSKLAELNQAMLRLRSKLPKFDTAQVYLALARSALASSVGYSQQNLASLLD